MRSSKHGDGRVQIICTLGPSSYDPEVIKKLTDRKVDLLRINLSHTPTDQVEERINHVRTHTDVPVSLDTEGSQVRCGRGRERPRGAGRLVDRTGRGGCRGHRKPARPATTRDLLRASRGFTGGDRLPRRRAPCHRHGRRVGSSRGRARGGPGVEQGGGREPGGPAPAAVGKGSVGPLDRPTARGRPLRARRSRRPARRCSRPGI